MGIRKSRWSETLPGRYLERRISRAQLLKATTAGLAVAAIPTVVAAEGQAGSSGPGTQSFPFFPQAPGRYTTENVTEIVSTLLTSGYLVVTALATRLSSADAQGLP